MIASRQALRKLTGREPHFTQVTYGHRPDGKPGATLYVSGLPGGSVNLCFSNTSTVQELLDTLSDIKRHLES